MLANGYHLGHVVMDISNKNMMNFKLFDERYKN